MPSCTMCQKDTPNEFGYHNTGIQPIGGLHISIHTGYGMMTDPMDEASCDALKSICLCHDCSIVFIELFPKEFTDNFFMDGHPAEVCKAISYNHPSGCDYSWC